MKENYITKTYLSKRNLNLEFLPFQSIISRSIIKFRCKRVGMNCHTDMVFKQDDIKKNPQKIRSVGQRKCPWCQNLRQNNANKKKREKPV